MSDEDETSGETRLYMEFVKRNRCTLSQLLEIANVSITNKLALVELAIYICIDNKSINELGILHNDIRGSSILVKRSSQTHQYKAIFIYFGLRPNLTV